MGWILEPNHDAPRQTEATMQRLRARLQPAVNRRAYIAAAASTVNGAVDPSSFGDGTRWEWWRALRPRSSSDARSTKPG